MTNITEINLKDFNIFLDKIRTKSIGAGKNRITSVISSFFYFEAKQINVLIDNEFLNWV